MNPPPPPPPFLWDRSACIGLAKASCVYCHGYGLRPVFHAINRGAEAVAQVRMRRANLTPPAVRVSSEVPCNCVFRAAFRAVYNRFKDCAALRPHVNAVTWDRPRGTTGYRFYSRKREEFSADFCLIARRSLEDLEAEIFRRHFVRRADWRACCRQLSIDRGTFFHRVYEIEVLLGRVFAETLPYPLYPVAEYFGGIGNAEVLAPRIPWHGPHRRRALAVEFAA
jgi:hypothetical protein